MRVINDEYDERPGPPTDAYPIDQFNGPCPDPSCEGLYIHADGCPQMTCDEPIEFCSDECERENGKS